MWYNNKNYANYDEYRNAKLTEPKLEVGEKMDLVNEMLATCFNWQKGGEKAVKTSKGKSIPQKQDEHLVVNISKTFSIAFKLN